MPKLRVHNVAISLDGYVAGPDQSPDNPLGVGGEALHEWVFETRAGHQMQSMDGGETGLDDDFLAKGDLGIGATIMGRNMFGPIRGPWGAENWTGWWGDNPPYHHPVFVLTHHQHPPIPMDGGTTFHFVQDGIEAALALAFDAAGGDDVRIGGGASTIQQYLRAGLIDDMHRRTRSVRPRTGPAGTDALTRDRAHPARQRRAPLRASRRWRRGLRVCRVRELAVRRPCALLPCAQVGA